MATVWGDARTVTHRISSNLPVGYQRQHFQKRSELQQLELLDSSFSSCTDLDPVLLTSALLSRYPRVVTLAAELSFVSMSSCSDSRMHRPLLRALIIVALQSQLNHAESILVQHSSRCIDEELLRMFEGGRSLIAQERLLTLILKRYAYFKEATCVDYGRSVRIKGVKRAVFRRGKNATYYQMVLSILNHLNLTEDIWIQGAARHIVRKRGLLSRVHKLTRRSSLRSSYPNPRRAMAAQLVQLASVADSNECSASYV